MPLQRKTWSSHAKSNLMYLLFLLPAFALLLGVTLYPAIYNIFLSFTNMSLRTLNYQFVGFGNYARLLQDVYVWEALGRTLIYMALGVMTRVVVGLLCAMLLRRQSRFHIAARVAIILPWVMSEIMVSAIWLWLLNHQTGLINAAIGLFGADPIGWLIYPELSMLSLTAVSLWKNLAFTYLLLFAALQQIPTDLYEASRIDGCNSWKSFRHVTLPLIKPTLMIVTVMVSISAFGQFSLAYSLTGGGPVRATELIGLYMYKQAFTYMDLSYGTAIGVLVFFINITLTLFYRRIMRSDSIT